MIMNTTPSTENGNFWFLNKVPNSKKFVPGQIMTKDGNGIRITGVLISQDSENEINDNVRPTFELMKVQKDKDFVFPTTKQDSSRGRLY